MCIPFHRRDEVPSDVQVRESESQPTEVCLYGAVKIICYFKVDLIGILKLNKFYFCTNISCDVF